LHVTATATEGRAKGGPSDLSITPDRTAAAVVIEGGSGSDAITGGAGGENLYGSSMPHGSTKLPGVAKEADNDVLHGGGGDDVIYGQNGNDTLFGDDGDDWLSGGKGNDVLHGGTGANTVNGDSGDDVIYAEGGDDTVLGGSGFDTLDFSMAVAGISFDVSKHTAVGFNTTSFRGIEKIIGSSHADDHKGSSSADVLDGGAGNDVIRGLGGAALTGEAMTRSSTCGRMSAMPSTTSPISAQVTLDLHDFPRIGEVLIDQRGREAERERQRHHDLGEIGVGLRPGRDTRRRARPGLGGIDAVARHDPGLNSAPVRSINRIQSSALRVDGEARGGAARAESGVVGARNGEARIDGTIGNDTIFGSSAEDVIYGNAGNDALYRRRQQRPRWWH
jgi:Ca2+-binding RTX toxin-like protein